jgi:hypothetical protein
MLGGNNPYDPALTEGFSGLDAQRNRAKKPERTEHLLAGVAAIVLMSDVASARLILPLRRRSRARQPRRRCPSLRQLFSPVPARQRTTTVIADAELLLAPGLTRGKGSGAGAERQLGPSFRLGNLCKSHRPVIVI